MAAKALTGTITMDLDKTPAPVPSDDALLESIASLEVVDEQSDLTASEIMAKCSSGIDAIVAFFADMKNTAHQAHATICAKEKEACKKWADAKLALNLKIVAYRKQVRDDKQRAQAAIDRQANAEQQEKLRKAKELRESGQMSKAAVVENEANSIVVPVLPTTGVSSDSPVGDREPWIGEVTSVMEVVQTVATGKQPLLHMIKVRGKGMEEHPLLIVNPLVLAHLAKTHMDTLAQHFPGLKAEQDLTLAVRRR